MIARIMSVHHVASKDVFDPNLWLVPARAGALPASSCDRGSMAHSCAVSQYALLCFRAELRQQTRCFNRDVLTRSWTASTGVHVEKTEYVATICNQYLMVSLHFCDSGSCPSRAGAGKQTTGWPCQLHDLFILWCQKQDFARQNGIRSTVSFVSCKSLLQSLSSWRPSYCKPSSSKSMFGPQLPSIDKVRRITWWNWPFSTRETLFNVLPLALQVLVLYPWKTLVHWFRIWVQEVYSVEASFCKRHGEASYKEVGCMSLAA